MSGGAAVNLNRVVHGLLVFFLHMREGGRRRQGAESPTDLHTVGRHQELEAVIGVKRLCAGKALTCTDTSKQCILAYIVR